MSDECERVERTAHIDMTFSVCLEHGQASQESVALEVSGVDPYAVVKALLATAEQMIAVSVTTSEENTDADNEITQFLNWTEPATGTTLGERAQKQLLDLISHQFLLDMVAKRPWAGHSDSAHLIIPHTP